MNPESLSLDFVKEEFLQGKILAPFESSSDHYTADAAIVWCFDNRFASLLGEFMRAKNIRHKDLICIAGGLKTLASPDSEDDRAFVLGQVRASIALHRAPVVYLMAHSDCGKYGGLKAFAGDHNKELMHLRVEAKKAADYLATQLGSSAKVEPVYADFQGVWRM